MIAWIKPDGTLDLIPEGNTEAWALARWLEQNTRKVLTDIRHGGREIEVIDRNKINPKV